jgi:wyosine [tRNA(Phe)-imidazoG37] synthetase (radical SAM superfamily)
VLPSLDAATEQALQKINRPLREFGIGEYIRGLVDFRREFNGKIWLEVFILPGYNDDHDNILALKSAIRSIGPDRIQLNTLDRPGVIERLRPATREELEDIEREWSLEHVEIVVPPADRHHSTSYRTDTENAILETISRRPCTLEDIAQILGIRINEVNKYLGTLEANGKIETTRQKRGVFYQIRKS